VEQNPGLAKVINQIQSGFFSPNDPTMFHSIYDNMLVQSAPYFVLADYSAYIACQAKVSELFKNQQEWHKTAILNVARMGKFSTDRTIQEYTNDIWKVEPCPID
jgi:starch phosphorylase